MKDKEKVTMSITEIPATLEIPTPKYSVSCLICGKTIGTYDYPMKDIGVCEDCKKAVAYIKEKMSKEKQIDNSWRAKMVENGIYKDSETTSNKMIEEICKMAVMGCRRNPQAKTVEECVKCEFKHGMCDVYRLAETLYNENYCRIDKDSVVLSKEEYNEIKQYQSYIAEIKKAFDKVRNATAENFLNMLYWKAVKHIKGKNKDECFIEISFEKLDELAKQFGVEIKE